MRALHLDYQAAPRRSKAAAVVLAAGLTLAFAALANFHHWREQASQWQAELALAQGKVNRSRTASDPLRQRKAALERAEEIKTANGVIRQLNFPWAEMFGALETATSPEVALLGVEPDARKNLVRVTAECKTDQAMLNYIRRLQQSELLADVTLQKHEIQAQDVERPLRFTVTGTLKNRE